MAKTAAELSAETAARRPKTGTQQRREQEARAAAPAGLNMNATTTNKETAMPTSKSSKSVVRPAAASALAAAVVARVPQRAPATATAPAPAVVAPEDMELVYTPTSRTLKTLESVIQKGLEGYVKAGHALREINERKLYTEATNPQTGEKFVSFEAYVVTRWDMTKQRAHQIIDASKVIAALVTHGARYLPTSEFGTRQIADLAKDDPATAVEIVNQTGDASPTGKVTAKALAETRTVVAPQRAMAGGMGGSSKDSGRTATFKGSGITRPAVTIGVPGIRASGGGQRSAASSAEVDRLSDLKNLNDLMVALREGMLNRKDDEIVARVQRLAGLALTWLAGEWVDGKEGQAKPLVISQVSAKYIAGKLLEAQEKARAERLAAEAVALKKNQATVAASKAAAPAPVVEPEVEEDEEDEAPEAEPKTAQQLSDEEWAVAVLRDPNAGPTHQRIAREILGMPAVGVSMAATTPAEDEESEEEEDEDTDESEVEEDEAEDEALEEDAEEDEDEDEDEEAFDFEVEEEPAPPAQPARTTRQVAARQPRRR